MRRESSRGIDHETCVAYYRDALSPRRAAQVRAYLDANPGEARLATVDAEHDRAIAQSLEGPLHEPIPARLRFEARPAAKRWQARLAPVAMIVVSAVVGWWFGGMAVTTEPDTTFTERVLSAAQQPAAQATTRTVATVPMRVTPPDLSLQGYRLVHWQRLEHAEPVLIEFVYRNAGGEQVRIYAETSPEEEHSVPVVTSRDGMSLAQWREGDTRYALVANLPKLSLQTLAQAAREGALGSGGTLAGADQWRAVQPDSDNPRMTLQQSLPVAEDVVPAAAGSDVGLQPGRM